MASHQLYGDMGFFVKYYEFFNVKRCWLFICAKKVIGDGSLQSLNMDDYDFAHNHFTWANDEL